jgi:phosphoglycolate phosphatase-like HAD superfamily hydrolase
MKTFLLFDIDGTLLFSDRLDSRCFAASYEAVFGQSFPSIDWSVYPHVTDHVIFRTVFQGHFGRDATPQERATFEARYLSGLQEQRTRTPEDFREVPGARRLWEEVSVSTHFIPGIATGGWRAPARIKLAHVGISPDPPYAGYADGMESRDAILQAAIDRVRQDHPIARIIYIGDAVWDVQTTRRMGIPFIGIRYRGDHQVLRAAGAERVLTDFRDPDRFWEIVHAVE